MEFFRCFEHFKLNTALFCLVYLLLLKKRVSHKNLTNHENTTKIIKNQISIIVYIPIQLEFIFQMRVSLQDIKLLSFVLLFNEGISIKMESIFNINCTWHDIVPS